MAVHILREAVIGWVIVQNAYVQPTRYRHSFVSVVPLTPSWEDLGCTDSDIGEDTVVLATIPALPGTFRVSCWSDDAGSVNEELGFEIPGTSPPCNWEEMAQERYQAKVEAYREKMA